MLAFQSQQRCHKSAKTARSCLLKPVNLIARKAQILAGQTQLSSKKPNSVCQICQAISQCKTRWLFISKLLKHVKQTSSDKALINNI